ncbi:carbonic anhydrase family protein [Weissella sagaensis]|uniref:carbonic anhydrase family protein n=1 Tax=Weissella sagaensis TaxID=2559928 RepID=UPI0013ECDFCB|nr:carbonic anhydrase family protein [Weissella sagaensis]
MEQLDYSNQAAWTRISGDKQSPIALSDTLAVEINFETILSFNYKHLANYVRDTGAGIEVGLEGTASIGNRPFRLKQFHIHTPSEHTVNDISYDAEIHFVHEASDGRLAVVAILVQSGNASQTYDAVLAHMDKTEHFEIPIDDIMPVSKAYYHYIGSLTTPPLTENVEWYVLKQPVTLSVEQLNHLKTFYSHNNRDLQALNGRPIISSN